MSYTKVNQYSIDYDELESKNITLAESVLEKNKKNNTQKKTQKQLSVESTLNQYVRQSVYHYAIVTYKAATNITQNII